MSVSPVSARVACPGLVSAVGSAGSSAAGIDSDPQPAADSTASPVTRIDSRRSRPGVVMTSHLCFRGLTPGRSRRPVPESLTVIYQRIHCESAVHSSRAAWLSAGWCVSKQVIQPHGLIGHVQAMRSRNGCSNRKRPCQPMRDRRTGPVLDGWFNRGHQLPAGSPVVSSRRMTANRAWGPPSVKVNSVSSRTVKRAGEIDSTVQPPSKHARSSSGLILRGP